MSEIEEQAKNLGWEPLETFRGDPDKHIAAETFLERAETNMPMMASNNKRLQSELLNLRRSVDEFKEFSTAAKDREVKAAYEQARAEAIEEQKAAIREQDTEAFGRAKDKEIAAETQVQEHQQKSAEDAQSKEQAAIYQEFLGENPWFSENATLYTAAQQNATFLQNQKPHLQGREFLDEMVRLTKDQNPSLFEEETAPRTEDGGRQIAGGPRRRAKAHSYANLPAEAKAKCDGWVKEGLLTQEVYLESYDWDDE